VVDHFLQRDRQGGGVAEHHHRQRIAHKHRFHTGGLHQRRREGIPGSEHPDRQTGLLALDQICRAQGHAS